MKIKLFTLAICVFALTIGIQAQTLPKKDQKKDQKPVQQKLSAKDYDELLEKLKKGDTAIDFAKLRLAYTETKNYSPYGGSAERNAMLQELNDENYKEAVETAEKMLKTNYVDLHSHFVLGKAHRAQKKDKEADFHDAVFKGLMDAIQQNDGKTAKTAMISIGISEQYFIMGYLGFERGAKGLVREGDSIFDVHTVKHRETDESRQFYFNIDKVFGKF